LCEKTDKPRRVLVAVYSEPDKAEALKTHLNSAGTSGSSIVAEVFGLAGNACLLWNLVDGRT
jgi:hypothetical protein